jgi:mono/diheme cytochrome c family protein
MGRGSHGTNDVRPRRLARLLAVAAMVLVAPPTGADVGDRRVADDARIAAAWRLIRNVDCARCHGKTYDGLAAPSIVAYAASQDRAAFIRIVLDGDPPRGMPGYRGNAYVAENIDDIYRYFVARAREEIGRDYRPPMRAEPDR